MWAGFCLWQQVQPFLWTQQLLIWILETRAQGSTSSHFLFLYLTSSQIGKIFKSFGILTFSQRQFFTKSIWGYIWSLDFSRRISSKDIYWNSNFLYRRADCIFISMLGGPVLQSTPEAKQNNRIYQWQR